MQTYDRTKNQTYNDGVLKVYCLQDTSGAGAMPNETPVFKVGPLRYENRTVGMNRYWQGKQMDVQIDRLVRCPKVMNVLTFDIAETEDGSRYKIMQVQYPKDVMPPSMDLSLERLAVKSELEPEESDDDA